MKRTLAFLLIFLFALCALTVYLEHRDKEFALQAFVDQEETVIAYDPADNDPEYLTSVYNSDLKDYDLGEGHAEQMASMYSQLYQDKNEANRKEIFGSGDRTDTSGEQLDIENAKQNVEGFNLDE